MYVYLLYIRTSIKTHSCHPVSLAEFPQIFIIFKGRSMDYFEIIRMILLVITMSAAVVDDCRRYRISNKIIICGFIAANWSFLTEQIMKGGAMQYLTACIAGLGVMSAIYIVKGCSFGFYQIT